MSGFNLAQTFFVDADAAQQASSVYVTSIDLYFYGKPTAGKTKSGISKPGVSLFLCNTNTDGSPNLQNVKEDTPARVEFDSINVSTAGTSATTFTFSEPISVSSGKTFAFLVKFDGGDPDFKLWYNKSGEVKLGTTQLTSVSSGKVDGSMFVITNGNQLTPQSDADISFTLKVAKFTTTPTTFKVKNRPYEILKVSSLTTNFIGGEQVYEQRANNTGTIATVSTNTNIVGVGTSFSSVLAAGDSFVITDGTAGNTNVRKVTSVTNTTFMTIDTPPSFTNASAAYFRTVTGTSYFVSGQSDHVIIQDSTANTTTYLTVGSVIKGIDSQSSATVANIQTYAINAAIPSFVVLTPAGTTSNATLNFANSGLAVSGSTAQDVEIGKRARLDKYAALIASHTTEATTATAFVSAQSTLKFTTTNPYVSPRVQEHNLDLFLETFEINNDATNEYLGRGNAKTRYTSKQINLATDQLGEDLKVYVRGYKPANTDIKVYAKLRNSTDVETLDVKDWTELAANSVGTTFSSSTNYNDMLELSYVIPFQPTGTLASGTFTTQNGNAVIGGTSGTVNTNIAVGNVVRVYSPYFSNSYFVSTVTASNTTTFTVAAAVSNASMVGSGLLVDTVTRKNSAYLDVQKQNIASYFNTSLAAFQGFDSFALKIVLLSDNGYAVPFVDDIRAIALSA